VIVTEDGQLKIYDPDLEQVTVRPLDEALVDTPLALLTQDAVELGADYAIEQLSPDSFRLHPSGIDALFDEIVLEFGSQGLQAMVIRDHLGQSTDIRFDNFGERSMIQSSDFTLDVPPGTDVF
jgi:outer membrane lipoprotein carrier protein